MVGSSTKTNRNRTGPEPRPRWRRLIRAGRRTLLGILVVLAGLILLLTFAFLLAPTRSAVLGWGVGIATKALPGSITAGKVEWPALGRLTFEDVLWVTESSSAISDTLAEVATLDLVLDLNALKQKDGRIQTLRLDVRHLDIPRIVETTAASTAVSVPDSQKSSSEVADFPFLRPGSLPGFPSVAMSKLDLQVDRARLAPGLAIQDLVLSGRADTGPGRAATAVIDHAGARLSISVGDTVGAPEWDVVVEHLGLGLNLDFLAAATGDQALVTAVMDSLNLVLAPTDTSSSRQIWQATERVSLRVAGGVERHGREYQGRLAGDFVLPGSANFQPWLPSDFPHEEFGPVAGQLELEGSFSEPQAKVRLGLDLEPSSWLETGRIAGSAEGDFSALRAQGVSQLNARLDTLEVKLEGVDLKASGDWTFGDFNVNLATLLTDFDLIGLFAAGVDTARADFWRDPGPGSLQVGGRVGRKGSEIAGRLKGDFSLPATPFFPTGLPEDFPAEEFETLSGRLFIDGSWDDPVAEGVVHLDLGENSWAEKGLLAGRAEANVDSLMTAGLRHLKARLDTLEVAMEGIRIKAVGQLDPETVALELKGEISDTRLAGLFAGPDLGAADLDIQVDARVTGSLSKPKIAGQIAGSVRHRKITIPEFDFTVEGDRSRVAAYLTAGGGLKLEGTSLDSVRAEVQGKMVDLEGLTANFGLNVWQRDNWLAVGGSVAGDTVRVIHLDSLVTVNFGKEVRSSGPATLTLGPGQGVFELTELELRGEAGSVNLQGFWNEEGRDLDAKIDLLLPEGLLQQLMPSELWSLNGGVDLKLEAVADLEGGDDDTRVAGQARAVLLPHRNEPPFGVAMQFTSRGGTEAMLNADFVLSSADTSLLKANLLWPGKTGPEAGFWNPDPERDLVLTVPPQKLDLGQINRRMPEAVVLNGDIDIAAEVQVFPPRKNRAVVDSLAFIPLRGQVEGTLGSSALRVDLPNRSWVNTVFAATVSGPVADPLIRARVEVPSGFIRIPNIPRNLHPIEGESQLWALNDSLLAAADSVRSDTLWAGPVGAGRDSLVVFLPPQQQGPSLEQSGPTVLPDLDIDIDISNDLRIIGYGADIKLGGKVKVVRGYDEDHRPGPALKGNLRIPEGTLKVMNRVFNVERGNIKFTETVPADPNLDLMLETQVNAYLLRVLISGHASAPVIELTAQPDLSEEDVMAVLLFGQPMNELDTDQRGRMQEENDPNRELQKNLAGLAMAFGTRGLQDSMSDSFGVDVVQMGSDSSGGSTLMVGKFITPDIMLKYNQSLEKSGTYFLTLEYTLNRYFKIVSTYGQGEEASGAAVQWSRRY